MKIVYMPHEVEKLLEKYSYAENDLVYNLIKDVKDELAVNCSLLGPAYGELCFGYNDKVELIQFNPDESPLGAYFMDNLIDLYKKLEFVL